jgi:CheY-like chemotaxis protein
MRRVCVVDDYSINLYVIKEYLKDEYDIVTFNSGPECIEYIKENYVDVVLMDCSMPVMSGYEATRVIKEIRPLVRVIGITANTYEEDTNKCYEAGMEAVMTKPIFKDSLIKKIEKK